MAKVVKDYDHEERMAIVDKKIDKLRNAADTEEKPLRAARSQAEITRVRQGWALIGIGVTNALIGAGSLIILLWEHVF